MPKAIITVGVSGSGKTTFAREYAQKHKAIISNRDDLRFSLTGAKDWSQYKFSKGVENIITEIQKETLAQCAARGKDIICADTNLDSKLRDNLYTRCKDFGYEVEIKPFPITLEEAWKRDALRPNGVGRDIIYKQWKQWLEFVGRKVYTPDTSLPKAIMFDIDGTLAHMTTRGPFEWGKVYSDTPDRHVVKIVRSYIRGGYVPLFVSGRDGVCAIQTGQWLEDYVVEPYEQWELHMRQAGDNRKDTIIKEEIFWRDIAPHYNVEAVVDDRPSVCRMWHDIGIPKVIQVGNPWEEF